MIDDPRENQAQYVKNRRALLGGSEPELRRAALDIAEAGIAAADPGVAVRREVRISGNRLTVCGRVLDLSGERRVFIIGAGKATYPVAEALDDLLGERIHAGLVVCKRGQEGALAHMELLLASHPVPDASSLAAAERTVRLLRQVRPGDVVLACFTGGSSSLFVQPAAGISLGDLATTTQVLLTCGANIHEINNVRKHFSTIKGGRLARMLPKGACLINLTVSDVIGDDLAYITDPTVPDHSTFADARTVLDRYDLWQRLPAPVTTHIRRAAPEDESVRAEGLAHLDRSDFLLVKANEACFSAARAAARRGFTPLVLSTFFEGESSLLGRNFAAIAREVAQSGHPVAAPCALIGGGETVVTTNGFGAMGRGGPNQEFTVGAALELAGTKGIVALGLDTDGTDGPTDYAGAIADGRTVAVARANGVSLRAALRDHDVSTALAAIGHHVVTGSTGTNVNDLKLVIVGAGAQL